MTPDILNAYDVIDQVSYNVGLDHQVHFDPRQFDNDNPGPTIEEFKLSAEELQHLGIRCTKLRAIIKQDVQQL